LHSLRTKKSEGLSVVVAVPRKNAMTISLPPQAPRPPMGLLGVPTIDIGAERYNTARRGSDGVADTKQKLEKSFGRSSRPVERTPDSPQHKMSTASLRHYFDGSGGASTSK
jgi:hypothetical protein